MDSHCRFEPQIFSNNYTSPLFQCFASGKDATAGESRSSMRLKTVLEETGFIVDDDQAACAFLLEDFEGTQHHVSAPTSAQKQMWLNCKGYLAAARSAGSKLSKGVISQVLRNNMLPQSSDNSSGAGRRSMTKLFLLVQLHWNHGIDHLLKAAWTAIVLSQLLV